MNASWNGHHDRFAGSSASSTACVKLERRVLAAQLAGDRVDALLPHRVVGKAKRLGHVGLDKRVDPRSDPGRDGRCRVEVLVGVLLVAPQA